MGYRVESYDPYGSMLEAEEQDDGNYIGKHWRGNLSLPQSYWLNGILTNVALAIFGGILLGLQKTGFSLRTLSVAIFLYFVLFLVLRVWTSVGIWRSAGRHAERGGSPGWGFIARGMVILGILVTVAQLPALGLQAQEYGLIAIGKDPLGPPAEIAIDANDDTLKINGTLSTGVASKFEAALDQAPKSLRLVQLESEGGRIAEAVRMAKVIRAKGLETRVERYCESACTLLLLAGKERSAHQFAQIGFHQPDFPGISQSERNEFIALNRRDYENEGIQAPFLDKVFATPPDEMWYPTHAEMVDAQVLSGEEIIVGSRKSDEGRLHEMLVRLTQITQAGRGTMLDEMTRLEGATLGGETIYVRHTITQPLNGAQIRNMQDTLPEVVLSDLCGSARRNLIRMGARFHFTYNSVDGVEIVSISADKCPDAAG